MLLLGHDEFVNLWVAEHGGGKAHPTSFVGMGWWHNGMVGGLVFHDSNEVNCWVNIAIRPGGFARGLLLAGLRYAFGQLALRRLTFLIESDNIRSLKFVTGLGARCEATLRGATLKGDMHIYKLSPEECKLWRMCCGEEWKRTAGTGPAFENSVAGSVERSAVQPDDRRKSDQQPRSPRLVDVE